VCTKVFALCIIAGSAEFAKGRDSKSSGKQQGFETHDDSVINVRNFSSTDSIDVVMIYYQDRVQPRTRVGKMS
jgi:hypothetical protein